MSASDDGDPVARERQVDRLRRMTPAEKLALVAGLNKATDDLARAGIRTRHPEADDREVEMRLRELKYGADLMRAAYGWDSGNGSQRP